MKALIIAAHGSRKKESNREIAAIVSKVAKKAAMSFDIVDHAFLQFADPLLEEKINDIAKKGARQIVVFPFFIGGGSHVLSDIPDMIQNAREAYPDVQFKVTRYLGKIEAIEDVILHEVTR